LYLSAEIHRKYNKSHGLEIIQVMRINYASLPSTAKEGNRLQKKTMGNLGEIGDRKLR